MRASPALTLALLAAAPACEAVDGFFAEVPRTYSSAGNVQRIFSDDFSRAELGPDWRVTGPGARIVDAASHRGAGLPARHPSRGGGLVAT